MADNKKVYSISINGVKESISEIDSLISKIQYLDQRIQAMSRNTNINVKASGGGASASQLQEQDKVLKEIYATEQKIEQVRSEQYQSLLASKEALKEAKQDAEQLAAAERLTANAYSNTMSGMKQQLADIKRLMNTTDISDDMFGKMTQQANELNTKLKEIEVSYGQFGRNVGNYPGTAAEGFSKLTITVNGTAREFDNARQALRELTNERNTLKLMGEDVGDLDRVVKTLNSDIRDMSKSSVAMDNLLDTMEGFIAIANASKGLSALFGFDDNAIQQSIQKLVALQSILQGIETIKKQMQTGEGIGGIFAKGNDAVDKFSASLLGVSTNSKKAAEGTKATAAGVTSIGTASKGATIAVRALSLALKTIGIGLIITAIAYLEDAIEKWVTAESEAEKAQKRMNEVTNAGVKAYATAKGEIEAYKAKLDGFNGSKKEEEKIVNELNSKLGKQLGTYKDIKTWQEKLNTLGDAYCDSLLKQAEAQALLNQYTEAYLNLAKVRQNVESGEYHHWWQTKSGDAQADAREIAKAEKEVEEAMDAYKKKVAEIQELNKNNKLFDYSDGEDTKKGIKKTGRDIAEETKRIEQQIANDRVAAMKQGFTKTMTQLKLERDRRIQEAKKSGILVGEQIKAIEDLYNRKSIDALVKHHQDMIKEEKQYQDQLKRAQEETYEMSYENSKRLNEISLQKNQDRYISLDDTSVGTFSDDRSFIRSLTIDYEKLNTVVYDLGENVMTVSDAFNEVSDDANTFYEDWDAAMIRAIQSNANLSRTIVKDLESVVEEYNTLLDKQEYFNKMVDKYEAEGNVSEAESWRRELDSINDEIERFEARYEGISQLANERITNDLQGAIMERYEAYQTYYRSLLEFANEQADKELAIEKDKLEKEIDQLRKAEDERHRILTSRAFADDVSDDERTRYKAPISAYESYKSKYDSGEFDGMSEYAIANMFAKYREEMDKWLKDLEKGFQEGSVTAEEYLDIMDSEFIKFYVKAREDANGNQYKMNEAFVQYLERVRNEQETHNNRLSAIQVKYNSEEEKLQLEHLNKLRQNTQKYYSSITREIERSLSAIKDKVSKTQYNQEWNFINFKRTTRALKELRATTFTEIDKIKQKKAELDKAYSDGKIGVEDYENAIDQLNALESQAYDTLSEISSELDSYGEKLAAAINYWVQAVGQAVGTIWSSIAEIQSNKYQEQIDELQDFIDAYEDELDNLADIIQEHSDKVNDIEDELKTARGDRRQALIDQLNAEKIAQRQALAEEKRIQKEKEKAEKKQRDLMNEQAKKEKQAAVAQAAINAVMAVSMAAVNHWPIPAIPMMALAAAAGAAQLAAVMSKPVPKYASGGVIQGPEHSQGGVKVLGGYAEVEGREFITNKVTTSKNQDLLYYINSKRKKLSLDDFIDFYSNGNVSKNVASVTHKFADGGTLPTITTNINIGDRLLSAFEDYSNRPVIVQTVDIIDRIDNIREVQVLAGLS